MGSRSTSRSSPASPRRSSAALGDDVRSGSFAVEGAGDYSCQAVGADSYAEGSPAWRARSGIRAHRSSGRSTGFCHARRDHRAARGVLGYALWEQENTARRGAVPTVGRRGRHPRPGGADPAASLTYAVAALRMARRGALAQQLNAIESLASVDDHLPRQDRNPDRRGDSRSRASSRAGRRRGRARPCARSLCGERRIAERTARRRSPGATTVRPLRRSPRKSLLLAPALECRTARFALLCPRRAGALPARRSRHDRQLGAGPRATRRRACRELFATDRGRPGFESRPEASRVTCDPWVRSRSGATSSGRPRDRRVLPESGCAAEGDLWRPPTTVAAVAADAGIPSAGPPLDGRDLPEDPDALRRAALEATVIGRISPEGKQRVVEALTEAGCYVAMVGDGVNDVPALKTARLAIAQGTGSQMAKSVADIVLVRGDFAAVPHLVDEGRKILRNLQRVSKLFVTKSAFAAFLIVTIGITPHRLPAAAATSDARRDADDRHPCVLPRARAELGTLALTAIPARGRHLRDSRRTAAGLGVARATCSRSTCSTCRSSRRGPWRRPCSCPSGSI